MEQRIGAVLCWIVSLVSAGLHFVEIVGYHHSINTLSVPEQKVVGLKTENAFYYSYYEETVSAPSVVDAFWRVVQDDRSEAPEVVNALERFNVYQEICAGLLYRLFRWILGEEWLPDPWYFFRGTSYALNASGQFALMSLVAACGGGGFVGGALPAVTLTMLLAYHRRDSGRIHDVGMLNLRENWTLPVIWWQVLCLHRYILSHPSMNSVRAPKLAVAWRMAFIATTAGSIALWQFSAFAFLLQVSAVFLCTLVSCSAHARALLRDVVVSQLCGVLIATVLLFGNELLVHHMIVTQCAAIWAVLRWRPKPPRSRWLFWVDGALAVSIFLAARLLQSRWATAEEHIGEIFAGKIRYLFPDLMGKEKEPTFNARLYFAVSVFNVIDVHTVRRLGEIGAYYMGAVGLVLWGLAFVRRCCCTARTEARASDADVAHPEAAAELAASFSLGVLLAEIAFFAVLGGFISRLKVFFCPLLFVLAAAAAAPGPLAAALGGSGRGAGGSPSSGGRCSRVLTWLPLAASCAVQLGQIAYVAQHMPMSLPHLEAAHRDMHWADGNDGELYDWMVRHLPAGATVVASMPLSAQLRLHTPLRVVIHPQFEKQSLRDRVQEIYIFYQCTSPGEFASVMRKYRATFFVIEYKRCDFSPFILDARPELNCRKGERPWADLFCPRLHGSKHFKMLYVNAAYGVFRLRNSTASGAAKTSITKASAWKPVFDSCLEAERQHGAACVPRIAELGHIFHDKLKQPQIARVALSWAEEHGAKDGVVQHVLGQHFDYDLENPKEALAYYRRAYELLPRNPVISREYLMILDVERKDHKALAHMMRPRRWAKGGLPSFAEAEDAALACDASVPALDLFRDLNWAEELWGVATRQGIGSDCVKNNWPLKHNGKSMDQVLGKWGFFLNIFWHHRIRSHLASFSRASARWQPPRRTWSLSLAATF